MIAIYWTYINTRVHEQKLQFNQLEIHKGYCACEWSHPMLYDLSFILFYYLFHACYISQ